MNICFSDIENGAGAASADVAPITPSHSGEPASEQEVKVTALPGGQEENSGETTNTETGGAQMPDNVNVIKTKDGSQSG